MRVSHEHFMQLLNEEEQREAHLNQSLAVFESQDLLDHSDPSWKVGIQLSFN
jgi:hypothetical protein